MCLQHRIGDTVLVRIGESDARNFFGTGCFQILGAWRFHLGKWDRRCSVLFWICRFSQPLAHKKIDPHWSLPGAAENIALRHFFSGRPIGYGVIPIFFSQSFRFCSRLCFDVESTSATRRGEKPYATLNCSMGTPGGQWLACIDAKNEQKFQNAQKLFNVRPWAKRLLVGRFRFAAKIGSSMKFWAFITSEWYPYQKWQMNYCVEPRKQIERPSNSTYHGFRRPITRHGVLMRKF